MDEARVSGEVRVWMAGWQLDCCGEPFRVGDRVSLRLREPTDVGWLDIVLPGIGATIDACEDHHGPSEDSEVTGTVGSIALVHCRSDPEPAAGSGVVTPVAEAEKWTDDLGDRRFAGFLIGLNVASET